jgi:hypothetical protein
MRYREVKGTCSLSLIDSQFQRMALCPFHGVSFPPTWLSSSEMSKTSLWHCLVLEHTVLLGPSSAWVQMAGNLGGGETWGAGLFFQVNQTLDSGTRSFSTLSWPFRLGLDLHFSHSIFMPFMLRASWENVWWFYGLNFSYLLYSCWNLIAIVTLLRGRSLERWLGYKGSVLMIRLRQLL